jgi:transcription termination/antitermination protein NusG
MPLFPGYVFVKIGLEESIRILNIRGVVSFVGMRNKPSPIPDEEIVALQTALACRSSVVVPYFPSDTRVRILSGPLTGLQGVVVREKGKSRMIVFLDLIKRSVSVELDALDLEKVR